jgi:prevent-host-death family protein
MEVPTVQIGAFQCELFSHVRNAEKGGRCLISRHGAPVAALVSLEDVRALKWFESHANELLACGARTAAS